MSEKITPEQYTAFLVHLQEMPNIARAARKANFSRQVAYNYRGLDPAFAASWDAALAESLERMEEIAHRRGFEGHAKPLVHQGQLTYQRDYAAKEIDPENGQLRYVDPMNAPYKRDTDGQLIPLTVPEVSDTVLMFMLKAHLPDKYRERTDLNVSGTIDIANAILAARKRSGTT